MIIRFQIEGDYFIKKLKSYFKDCRRLFTNKLLHLVSMSARNIIGQQSLVGVQPIINNNHFTFVKLLEENWDSIYDELIEVLRYRDLIPSFHEISKEQYKISKGKKWKTFAFFSFGRKFKYNCSYAPNTVKLLECIPNLQSAWFSVIAPGYHVPKHKGITRGILRSHLGLSIPNNPKECFMDIGNDRIYWQQGKVVIFDDSTSAIDTQTEKKIREEMMSLGSGITLIVKGTYVGCISSKSFLNL